MPPFQHSRRRFLKAPTELTTRSARDETPLPDDSLADTYLIHFSRPAMGCQFEVLLNAGPNTPHAEKPGETQTDPEQGDSEDTAGAATTGLEQSSAAAASAAEAAMEALDRVEFLEHKLSLYQPHSALCQLNRQAGRGAQAIVDDDIWQLLVAAEQLHRESGGAFDITMSPLSRLWGFHHKQGRLPEESEIETTLSRVGMQHVKLDHEAHTIELARPGMELSFASLGKGLALDQCGELLRASGVDDFLVHGGYSSLLARGRRIASQSPGAGWSIALRDPDRPEQRLGRILIRDFAVGTSGIANQSFIHRGRRYGHLLDPRSGQPVDHLVSATALAPRGMQADALATAFFVMGCEKTLSFCERHPELGAILVLPTGRGKRRKVVTTGIAQQHWLPNE